MNPYSELWIAEAHLRELRDDATTRRLSAGVRDPVGMRRRLGTALVALGTRLGEDHSHRSGPRRPTASPA